MKANQFVEKMICIGYAFIFFTTHTSYAMDPELEVESDQSICSQNVAFTTIEKAQLRYNIQRWTGQLKKPTQNVFLAVERNLYKATPDHTLALCGQLLFDELESRDTKNINSERFQAGSSPLIYNVYYPSGRKHYSLDLVYSSNSEEIGVYNVSCFYDALNEMGHPKIQHMSGFHFINKPQ
ncbi:MAG: hypothetical protein K2W94_06605 [Alphaproteobacteria bacterium]|nr:hypothetical protein [Alphaproteobacteria bacterium]